MLRTGRLVQLLPKRVSLTPLSMTRCMAIRYGSTSDNSSVEPKIPGFRSPGEIPTNFELATGNERYEYIKKLNNEEPWADLKPIHLTSKPTAKNPVVVRGVDPVRYIGCTGYPADSHEPVWLTIRPNMINRCPHCGNCFVYEQEEEHH